MRSRGAAGVLALIALLAAAAWLLLRAPARHAVSAPEAEATAAYDFEARDVVVQQLGKDGALLYQIEAREIRQQPDSGRITAHQLTLSRDPPGTGTGGPNRWTLRADSAELPAGGGVITLAGNIRAQGRLGTGKGVLALATEELRYDIEAEELASDAEVALTWNGSSFRGPGLRANIRTGTVALESIHGTLAP